MKDSGVSPESAWPSSWTWRTRSKTARTTPAWSTRRHRWWPQVRSGPRPKRRKTGTTTRGIRICMEGSRREGPSASVWRAWPKPPGRPPPAKPSWEVQLKTAPFRFHSRHIRSRRYHRNMPATSDFQLKEACEGFLTKITKNRTASPHILIALPVDHSGA